MRKDSRGILKVVLRDSPESQSFVNRRVTYSKYYNHTVWLSGHHRDGINIGSPSDIIWLPGMVVRL